MLARRHGESEIFNKFFQDSDDMKKIASNHPIEKSDIGQKQLEDNAKEERNAKSLYQVRLARRNGQFVKVAGRNDLYQEVETKDFWKISDDKKTVKRVVDEANSAN